MPPNTRRPAPPIEIRARARGRRSCVSRSIDEGEGIPAADLERIFDKFYRVQAADRQTRRHGPGPRDLPRLRRGHGRHASTAAQPHRRPGAVFIFALPVPDAPRRRGDARHEHAPLRMLVVDDEPAIRRFLRTSLAAQGYDVDGGGGRRAGAGQACGAIAVDVVVLDLGLPDIDGFEVIRRCATRARRCPIIVLSSRTDEARQGRGARPRRRRLCDKALRHGRTARARARRPAPPPAAGRRGAGLPQRRSRGRSRAPHRHGARRRR